MGHAIVRQVTATAFLGTGEEPTGPRTSTYGVGRTPEEVREAVRRSHDLTRRAWEVRTVVQAQAVAALRAQGMSTRQIAAFLADVADVGLSKSAVARHAKFGPCTYDVADDVAADIEDVWATEKSMCRIDAAGLALVARVGQAIASKGNLDPRRVIPAQDDPNPRTADLSVYDLARLLSYVGGPNPDRARAVGGEQIIWSMVETVYRTVPDRGTGGQGFTLRATRAAWVRFELDQLGINVPAEVTDRLEQAAGRMDP